MESHYANTACVQVVVVHSMSIDNCCFVDENYCHNVVHELTLFGNIGILNNDIVSKSQIIHDISIAI